MKTDLFTEMASVERMLDFHMERHGVLASNLANAETPEYQPHDLVMNEATPAGTLETTSAKHMTASDQTQSGSSVVELERQRVDGNGVQLERAMAEISANRLRYEAGIELATRQIAGLRYAATDGAG